MLKLAIDSDVRCKIRRLAEIAPTLGPGPLDSYLEPRELHVGLNAFNRARLHPFAPTEEWEEDLPFMRAAEIIEGRFVEEERGRAKAQAEVAPRNATDFAKWFSTLKESGPGQYDLFFEYLAYEASREEIQYFTKQEFCGEIGFDDLIALTQIRLPERAKLELARNFWDEQGQGNPEDVHGPLYEVMVHELGIKEICDNELLWETLAVANLLTALACNRRYTWQSLGALSVIELTSPTRASCVAKGLKRVGISDHGCRYFRLHSTLDVEHWKAWLAEVIIPLVSETPDLAVLIAEGAFLRLNAGARLIKRYRSELMLEGRLTSFA
jgi:pyrroloquinoline quinone (PQQ) biosynthesis protein C